MKKVTLFLFLLANTLSVLASHIYGGYLYATFIAGRTVQYTAVVYSDPTSPASQSLSTLNINFGDGTATNATRSEVQPDGNIQINTYSIAHTYSTDGAYMATINEPSLVSGVRNVNGGRNSNTVNFSIGLMVRIGPSQLNNGFVGKPLAFTLPEAIEGEPLHYNAVVSNQDYNLQSQFSINNNYNDSVSIQTTEFAINTYTGMIAFTPQASGMYVVPVKVETKQNEIVVARMFYLQPVRVVVGVAVNQQLYTANEAEWVNAGWYRKVVQTAIQTNYSLGAVQNANGLTYTLNAFGQLPDSTATITTRLANDSLYADLNWTPQATQERDLPYFVTYRLAPQQNLKRIQDVQVGLYHGAPLTASVKKITAANQALNVYPNPCSKNGSVTIALTGECEIKVFDTTGKILHEAKSNGNYILPLSELNANLLFIECKDKAGNTSHAKLIVQ
ncbi:MAG: T9SS type A sorting domain-containing protein [Bacteroidia bacterium]|jgi:hypothetical protein|nr:T9SS type A sorting domain-containing protein [Bacteroidia bacterium]